VASLCQASERLHAACRQGDVDAARVLIATTRVFVGACSACARLIEDVDDSSGRSALFAACLRGHAGIVTLLLDAGADVNQFVCHLVR
jgi:hypothetical protein